MYTSRFTLADLNSLTPMEAVDMAAGTREEAILEDRRAVEAAGPDLSFVLAC